MILNFTICMKIRRVVVAGFLEEFIGRVWGLVKNVCDWVSQSWLKCYQAASDVVSTTLSVNIRDLNTLLDLFLTMYICIYICKYWDWDYWNVFGAIRTFFRWINLCLFILLNIGKSVWQIYFIKLFIFLLIYEWIFRVMGTHKH